MSAPMKATAEFIYEIWDALAPATPLGVMRVLLDLRDGDGTTTYSTSELSGDFPLSSALDWMCTNAYVVTTTVPHMSQVLVDVTPAGERLLDAVGALLSVY